METIRERFSTLPIKVFSFDFSVYYAYEEVAYKIGRKFGIE